MAVPLLLHTTNIRRKQKVAGKGVSSQYVSIATGVKCLVIPQTDNYNITRDWVFGQDYIAIFDVDIDIKAGDRLEASTGVNLVVSGRPAVYKDVPLVAHIECACTTEGA